MAETALWVVVKFRDEIGLSPPDVGGPRLEDALERARSEFADRFPGIVMTPVFSSLDPRRIRELLDKAEDADPTYERRNLLNYYRVDVPLGQDAEAIAEAFRSWPIVETAFVKSARSEPPSPGAAGDPLMPKQVYLDAKPAGHDVKYAWTFAGGTGGGIGFVDVEQGWFLAHEDLPLGLSVDGDNHSFFSHGTKVLGIVLAVHNTVGIRGIAHGATPVKLVSEWRTASTRDVADAILFAANLLSFGDVLLLEYQTDLSFPGEVELDVFDAIRLSTALGVVVVEAAGNGQHDLDVEAPHLKKGGSGLQDSLAILVAGAKGHALKRHNLSNYGTRIDCFAAGDGVTTTGDPGGANVPAAYDEDFGITSAAAAIVAGLAAVLQGLAEQNRGFRFSPPQVRRILSDPGTNTLTPNHPAERIGVKPDLRRIIDTVLLLTPDVYVRDHVGDTGDPNPMASSTSPDVFIRHDAVPDPQAAFGEGSSTEDEPALGSTVMPGVPNDVHVRVRNRGGADASNVAATVYWSAPTTLLTGLSWTEIGTTAPPVTVPKGDVLTVLPTLPFNAPPPAGHYCLIALVGADEDPPPLRADFLAWDRFLRFVRDNNNVAWRNFDVVSPAEDGPTEMMFNAAGPPDRGRRMRFEVVARLPEDASLHLEGPAGFVRELLGEPPLGGPERNERVALPLPPTGSRPMRQVFFEAGVQIPLKLVVRLPARSRGGRYALFARQIFDGLEVGRVTFRIEPAARDVRRTRATPRPEAAATTAENGKKKTKKKPNAGRSGAPRPAGARQRRRRRPRPR